MKKISLLFVGVLFCTLVFANGTDEPIKSSSVAVTNSSGSSLFKLYYSSDTENDVRVTITNQFGKVFIKEMVEKTNGFIRPYNFRRLAAGEYTIQVENAEGKHIEKVYYDGGKIEKLINVVKLGDDKYLLTVASKSADKVNVNIYDDKDGLIYSQECFVKKEFAEVINLKNRKAFTIEVTDSKGLLKTLKY